MKPEEIASQPEIATSRFTLRPLRPSDAGLIDLNAGDSRVALNTSSIPHPLPPGSTEALIARANAGDRIEDVWAMDGTKSGGSEVMGLIGLTRIDRDSAEVSFWVAPAHWNTGIASDALAALVSANPLGNRVIFASVFHDNPASARVVTNCGFAYLGDAEAFSVARNANVPIWTYSLKLE
ncbi:GNAT family N-acetyltransferase [Roseovarius sp. SYSU LYC5161]|uniref:GNAT family N-acetyltransferase n=1 Tax=Roseovarius halophilus (ex Wu et al. 2025) TaxID=3376060 RepID=UPI0028723B6A|nr:GNAT family protein [Roseovarius sp.]